MENGSPPLCGQIVHGLVLLEQRVEKYGRSSQLGVLLCGGSRPWLQCWDHWRESL